MSDVTRDRVGPGQVLDVSDDSTPRPEDRRDEQRPWTPLANPRRTRRS